MPLFVGILKGYHPFAHTEHVACTTSQQCLGKQCSGCTVGVFAPGGGSQKVGCRGLLSTALLPSEELAPCLYAVDITAQYFSPASVVGFSTTSSPTSPRGLDYVTTAFSKHLVPDPWLRVMDVSTEASPILIFSCVFELHCPLLPHKLPPAPRLWDARFQHYLGAFSFESILFGWS